MYCHIQKRLAVPCRVILGPRRREALRHIGRIQAYFLMEHLKKWRNVLELLEDMSIVTFKSTFQCHVVRYSKKIVPCMQRINCRLGIEGT